MTIENPNYAEIRRCLKEIYSAEQRIATEQQYVKECREYLSHLMKLDLKNPINVKEEAGGYKVSITLNPTVKVDEEKLQQMDWSKYTDIITTKHEITGAKWRNLDEESKKALADVVTTKYNQPTYKVERVTEGE